MEYFKISREELGRGAKIPLKKLGDSGEVFYELALEMLEEIKKNNARGLRSVLICPVGPVGQYPIFVRLVNEGRVSLKDTWFINMDEYLNDDETWISREHKLSFRGFMDREVYSRIDPELVMPQSQRVFPDPQDVRAVPALIQKLGGVNLALGGIGINGHLAFNEAQDELTPEAFAALSTRVLSISRETRVANAIGDLNFGHADGDAFFGHGRNSRRRAHPHRRVQGLAQIRRASGGLRGGFGSLPGHAFAATSRRGDLPEPQCVRATLLR